MRLWSQPGTTLELWQLELQVAPPERNGHAPRGPGDRDGPRALPPPWPLVAGLEAEERGRRISRLITVLKRQAVMTIVIVDTPAMDEALQTVSLEAV